MNLESRYIIEYTDTRYPEGHHQRNYYKTETKMRTYDINNSRLIKEERNAKKLAKLPQPDFIQTKIIKVNLTY